MLALIVLTVVWSYAAHVYGHATVFHCFTRSIMLVSPFIRLLQLLLQLLPVHSCVFADDIPLQTDCVTARYCF